MPTVGSGTEIRIGARVRAAEYLLDGMLLPLLPTGVQEAVPAAPAATVCPLEEETPLLGEFAALPALNLDPGSLIGGQTGTTGADSSAARRVVAPTWGCWFGGEAPLLPATPAASLLSALT